MKKIFAIILVLMFVTTLIACTDEEQGDPNAVEAQPWAIAIDYGYPGEQDEVSDVGNEETQPEEVVVEVTPGE